MEILIQHIGLADEEGVAVDSCGVFDVFGGEKGAFECFAAADDAVIGHKTGVGVREVGEDGGGEFFGTCGKIRCDGDFSAEERLHLDEDERDFFARNGKSGGGGGMGMDDGFVVRKMPVDGDVHFPFGGGRLRGIVGRAVGVDLHDVGRAGFVVAYAARRDVIRVFVFAAEAQIAARAGDESCCQEFVAVVD